MKNGLPIRLGLRTSLIAMLVLAGCNDPLPGVSSARMRDVATRNLETGAGQAPSGRFRLAEERLAALQTEPPEAVKLSGDVSEDLSAEDVPPADPAEVFRTDLPDPEDAPRVFAERLESYGEATRRDFEKILPGAATYLQEIARPRRVRLGLNECIRRTLANNYQIRIEGFGPAISAAQVVQAEAAFDAAFFASVSRDNRDAPVASQLQSGESLGNVYTAGIRQRLPTGADLTVSQSLSRTDIPGFQFQTLNPAYQTNLVTELRQPLMRNFGVDFNRAQIDISKNNRETSVETFRRQVINTLNETERAYWDLVLARRQVVITAELLAQSKRTYDRIFVRRILDAFKTQIQQSRSQFRLNQVQFLTVQRAVFDAEDRLRNLMNDPEFNLADDIEIIPTDVPIMVPVVRNMFREVEIALDARPEVREARLAVENARIQIGVAKNQALPSLDFVVRHAVNGLGANADSSFDQMTSYNFYDTMVSLEFAWSFGERAERAGVRIAALQHSQAVAGFKQAIDAIITDVRATIRNLEVSHKQIAPSADGVDSALKSLRSILERAEDLSPERINSIFSAQSQVANSRQALLQAIISYNQAIIDVERSKGTLLDYNNIHLTELP